MTNSLSVFVRRLTLLFTHISSVVMGVYQNIKLQNVNSHTAKYNTLGYEEHLYSWKSLPVSAWWTRMLFAQ